MSKLTQVTKGKLKVPHLVLIYGPDGIGKSTFGASAPSPIFLGSEKGTAQIDTSRYPTPSNFGEFKEALDDLLKNKHEYQTLVLDSADWLDKLVQKHVCEMKGVQTIGDVGGGFGKGTDLCNTLWFNEIFTRLNAIREKRGMHIIIIAHAHVKKFKDPRQLSDYDKYQLQLPDTTAALFRQLVDAVLFTNYEIFITKENGSNRAIGDGARMVYAEERPGFHAKNRLSLPPEFPLSWEEFERLSEAKEGEKPEVLVDSIRAILKSVTNQKVKENVETLIKQAGSDKQKLVAIKNKVAAAVGSAA